MKNKAKYIILSLISTFIFMFNVNAECSYQERKELLNAAKNVDIFYEVKENVNTEKGTNTYGEELNYENITYEIIFNISNLSNDLIIKYYNTLNYEENYINSENIKDGIYKFSDLNYYKIYNYYFEIYSTNENCPGNKIYTKKIKKPIYNGYSKYSICNEKELETYKYCKKFVTEEIKIDEAKFIELANKQLKSEQDESNVETNIFFEKYFIYILIIITIIIISLVMIVIFKRKRRAL